jgi:hypothetical protein
VSGGRLGQPRPVGQRTHKWLFFNEKIGVDGLRNRIRKLER